MRRRERERERERDGRPTAMRRNVGKRGEKGVEKFAKLLFFSRRELARC